MTVHEIEYALAAARRAVFDEDEQVAECAGADITRLLALLREHPQEQSRRATLAANRDNVMLFRWL